MLSRLLPRQRSSRLLFTRLSQRSSHLQPRLSYRACSLSASTEKFASDSSEQSPAPEESKHIGDNSSAHRTQQSQPYKAVYANQRQSGFRWRPVLLDVMGHAPLECLGVRGGGFGNKTVIPELVKFIAEFPVVNRHKIDMDDALVSLLPIEVAVEACVAGYLEAQYVDRVFFHEVALRGTAQHFRTDFFRNIIEVNPDGLEMAVNCLKTAQRISSVRQLNVTEKQDLRQFIWHLQMMLRPYYGAPMLKLCRITTEAPDRTKMLAKGKGDTIDNVNSFLEGGGISLGLFHRLFDDARPLGHLRVALGEDIVRTKEQADSVVSSDDGSHATIYNLAVSQMLSTLGPRLLDLTLSYMMNEFANLQVVSALAPINGFVRWLSFLDNDQRERVGNLIDDELLSLIKSHLGRRKIAGAEPEIDTSDSLSSDAELDNALGVESTPSTEDAATTLPVAENEDKPSDRYTALVELLANPYWHEDPELSARLEGPLLELAKEYLITTPIHSRGNKAFCPSLKFHLANGAELHRLTFLGTKNLMDVKWGCGIVANYNYNFADLHKNRLLFHSKGEVVYNEDILEKPVVKTPSSEPEAPSA